METRMTRTTVAMQRFGWAALGVCAMAASACWGGVSHNYTHTAHDSYAAKAPTCDFDIQSTGPSVADYVEIGTLGGCSGTTDLGEYKEQIAPLVCQASGDLVMAEINTNGVYCRGIVFHRAPAPIPNGGAPAPNPAPAVPNGGASAPKN